MDDSSTYDHVECSDVQAFPENSSPNSCSTKAFATEETSESDSEPQHESPVYSTVTFSLVTGTDHPISNGSVQDVPRTSPKFVVYLCVAASIVIPLLAPFVLYFLLQSRLNWKRGSYTKAYRRVNQAANITLACVVLFVMMLLVTVLIIGVIAFQQSKDITNTMNTTSDWEHLELSKQILHSELLDVITSTTVPTSLSKSSILHENNNSNKTVNQSEQALHTDKFDDTTAVRHSTAHSSPDLQHAEETIETSPVVDNFSDLENKWRTKKLNATHIFVFNPSTNQNYTRTLDIKLPNQDK